MTVAKELTWTEGYVGLQGVCATHIYRIKPQEGKFLVVDNQNGWDCFSDICENVEQAKSRAQFHFDNLVAEMTKATE